MHLYCGFAPQHKAHLAALRPQVNLAYYLGLQRLSALESLFSCQCAVVDAQNNLTERVFKECDTRGRFEKLMTALYDYPHYGAPFRRGSRC